MTSFYTKINTPDWVKNAVFYQIFPDRFSRSIPTEQKWLLNIPLEDWNTTPTFHGYKGGNLWGIIEKLDYLQDLGINAIYLNPIFTSASNHRYHTLDYYQIDPLLGGEEAFTNLLKEAHHRKIKLILDGTFNHASRGFYFFNDILENGQNSPWLDWFKITGWPISPYDNSRPANYASWCDLRALPEFNTNNLGVREYIMRIGEYWIKRGADGWRLDSADYIKTPGFWQEFRERIKAINPEAYIVGEIPMNATEWLDGTQFDGVSSLPFLNATTAFIVGDRQVKGHFAEYAPPPPADAAKYGEEINQLLQLYPWEIQLTQLNGINNHDTARLIDVAGGDRPSLYLATLLLFTFPGAPCIYYGDEVGLNGGYDPECRKGFPDKKQWDQDILEYHRQLIKLRLSHPALRIGEYHTLYAQGQVYIFARRLETEILLIAVNAGNEIAMASIQPSWQNQLKQTLFTYHSSQENWTKEAEFINFKLPPRSGLIIG
ncbi:MAG: glycoside hydrolase family 13 protein [Nostocales cyanobacterium LacPavin_0920_SED1_MAG_38_18]|uniref:glycoside hydrolase family 13 protein n=1 Tax=Dolichospermum sp. UHCC 0315A TaxID=1914871 RepID=UPI0011E80ACD|nr:glycoside hydrolase family 13 protein [Dolichospermum sp. UHCC 0315A]MCX5980746.1 glycoside hydrolase family 13 protein [Nostocales cyanobacterium LacPavin_0920_SED1_MAG_38_18]QEI42083.1 Cyclomaltodextrinase [Dolichospermum sp. UHCC 0315A]